MLNEKDRAFLTDYADDCAGRVVWCSVQNGQGDVWAEDILEEAESTVFTIKGAVGEHTLTSALPGLHNVENALEAIVIARTLGVSWETIEQALICLLYTSFFDRVGD